MRLPDDPDHLMRIGPTARALGVSIGTVRRWADAGQIEVVRSWHGERRFRVGEIRRLLRQGTT